MAVGDGVSIPHRLATNQKRLELERTNAICFNPSQVGYKPRKRRSLICVSQCFNPSQVGYKPLFYSSFSHHPASFNPSQVGYKLSTAFLLTPSTSICFNPSQVGYKLVDFAEQRGPQEQFQSLIGWLQTLASGVYATCSMEFQSLIGWLQTVPALFENCLCDQFQSLIGWLQTRTRAAGATSQDAFQSLIGWLQTEWKSYIRQPFHSFNPSQVGYKLIAWDIPEGKKRQFQSLIGWLQTGAITKVQDDTSPFQSLIGWLQTRWSDFITLTQICFNPSQVGYKHLQFCYTLFMEKGFNPSQVGYKLVIMPLLFILYSFQGNCQALQNRNRIFYL